MDLKQAQVTYHDWESATYDEKWSISFDDRCVDYAVGRFRRAVPEAGRFDRAGQGRPFDRVLEIGCGTGFFLLNLAQGGVVGEAHATDISAGMVATCVRNGARLGIEVHGRVADAERLPYDDGAFDLVLGHAVAHHLPDLDAAFAEVRRVLRPGGRLVLAGEPTRAGDRIAAQWKRAGRVSVKLAAVVAGKDRVLGPPEPAPTPEDAAAAALEAEVDLHLFHPEDLAALALRAGLVDAVTRTEELTANWFGWWTRTVEAMVRPGVLPERYPWFAYRTWQRLSTFDERVARRVVPAAAFYNCVLSARAPGPRA